MALLAIQFQPMPCADQAGGARDRDDGVHLVRVGRRPLESLHASERTARDSPEPPDSKFVQARAGSTDEVPHGDDRKVGSVGVAGVRVRAQRARGAAAAAQQAQADHMEATGVERLAGTDHGIPPAESLTPGAVPGAEPVHRRFVSGPPSCRVRIGRERGADQDGVSAVRVGFSPRFAGDFQTGKDCNRFREERARAE